MFHDAGRPANTVMNFVSSFNCLTPLQCMTKLGLLVTQKHFNLYDQIKDKNQIGMTKYVQSCG